MFQKKPPLLLPPCPSWWFSLAIFSLSLSQWRWRDEGIKRGKNKEGRPSDGANNFIIRVKPGHSFAFGLISQRFSFDRSHLLCIDNDPELFRQRRNNRLPSFVVITRRLRPTEEVVSNENGKTCSSPAFVVSFFVVNTREKYFFFFSVLERAN